MGFDNWRQEYVYILSGMARTNIQVLSLTTRHFATSQTSPGYPKKREIRVLKVVSATLKVILEVPFMIYFQRSPQLKKPIRVHLTLGLRIWA